LNRNHYDGVRWTIGSIFIGASLALFGISFLNSMVNNPRAVYSTSIFSLALYIIWLLYHFHVERFVEKSLDRAKKIEDELGKIDKEYGMQLHTKIREQVKRGKGAFITGLLTGIIIMTWLCRMVLIINP